VDRKSANSLFPDWQSPEWRSVLFLLCPFFVVDGRAQPFVLYVLNRHACAVVANDYCCGIGAGQTKNLDSNFCRIGIVRILDNLNESDSLIANQMLAEYRYQPRTRPE
jgi:hypothetical protein